METTQEIKKYLNQAFYIDLRIKSKLKQIERWRELLEKITSVVSDLPKHHAEHDKMANTVAKIVDYESELSNDIEEMITLKSEITKLIEKVDNKEQRLILTMRYLDFMKWEAIATELSYSYMQTHRIHQKAMQSIKNIKATQESR